MDPTPVLSRASDTDVIGSDAGPYDAVKSDVEAVAPVGGKLSVVALF